MVLESPESSLGGKVGLRNALHDAQFSGPRFLNFVGEKPLYTNFYFSVPLSPYLNIRLNLFSIEFMEWSKIW